MQYEAQFLDLRTLKKSIIPAEADQDEDDVKLLEIQFDANSEINKVLLPFAEETPIPKGSKFFSQGKYLAIMYAKWRWALDNRQSELARDLKELYEQKRDSILDAFKAERTTRTRTVLISADPRRQKLLIPGQKDTFILDDY